MKADIEDHTALIAVAVTVAMAFAACYWLFALWIPTILSAAVVAIHFGYRLEAWLRGWKEGVDDAE